MSYRDRFLIKVHVETTDARVVINQQAASSLVKAKTTIIMYGDK